MVNDCPDPSLPERIRLLEQTFSLQAARIEVFRRKAERAEERARRAEEQLEKALRAEVLRRAGPDASPLVPMQMVPQPRKPAHKRDRHGMFLIKGLGGLAAGWAAVKAWAWATLPRKIATGAVAATVTAAGVTPVVIDQMPGHAGAAPVSVRHHREVKWVPPAQVPVRKKKQPSGRTERNTPSPSPSPSAAPGGTPASSPSPLPVVSATPTLPVPTSTLPSPTPAVCVPPPACHPLHVCCDGDGDTQLLSGPVMQTRVWLISKHRLRLAA